MRNKRFIKLLLFSILIIVLAFFISFVAGQYIKTNFPNRPVAEDLLWRFLPYYPIIGVAEILIVICCVYLVYYGIKRDRFLIPYAIILGSLFHIFRAGLIILTPLAFPYAYNGFLNGGQNSIFTLGAFPSGHISIPYFIFTLTKNKIILLLTFIIGLILLISRGHYTIDIIGGLLLAYPVFKFSEEFLKPYFLDK